MKLILKLMTFTFCVFSIYAQNKSCNCCTGNHQAFDFWVGTWTVTNPSGVLVGTNTIEKVQDNCVLRENWRSAKGNFTGTSYNFYNA